MQNQISTNGLYTPVFPSDWNRSALYDLAYWINGRAFKNSDFSDSGLPILKIAEIKNGLSEQTSYTTKKFDDDIFVTSGDILFSWSGTPETSIDIFSWKGFEGWLNQHTFRVEPKEIVDKKFFFYLLRYLKKVFVKIASNKKTTGLGHVTVNDLKNLVVAIPQKPQQEKITSALSTLDDKIEVNNKIAKTLDEMAQAIFKEWFVLPLIENKFQKGWEIKRIGDMAKINKGLSYSSKEINEESKGLPMINLANFKRGGGFNPTSIKHYIGKYKETNLVRPGDIVIAMTDLTSNREVIGHPARVPSYAHWDKILISLDVCSVDTDDTYIDFLYYLMLRKEFAYLMASSAGGTNVSHLSTKFIESYEFVLPHKELLIKFQDIVAPIFKKINLIEMENQGLSSMRDLLLPKLMRGEIRV